MSQIWLPSLVLSVTIILAGGYTVHAQDASESKEQIARDPSVEPITGPASAEAAPGATPLHPSALDDSPVVDTTEQDAADEDTVAIDSSHVLISAIKSVSGEIPENEFFH